MFEIIVFKILLPASILGFLIFVHEAGHFVVAKRSGVKVLRFSLGFGKRLFSWTKDETEYTISAIPLGGYVKMAGEQTTDGVPEPHDFLGKSIGTRFKIVFAGPLVNYVIGIIILWITFLVGFPDLSPTIGGHSIPPSKELAVSIQGRFGATQKQAEAFIEQVKTLPVSLIVRALHQSNIASAVPEQVRSLINASRKQGWILGSEMDASPEMVGLIQEHFDATLAQAEESIRRINRINFDIRATENVIESLHTAGILATVPQQVESFIEEVLNMPAQRAGLLPGDTIVAVEGVPVATWSKMTDLIHDAAGQPVEIAFDRQGEERTITVVPDVYDITDHFGSSKRVGLIGISPSGDLTSIKVGPIEAVGLTFHKHNEWMGGTLTALWSMITQKIKMKDSVTGPIGIFVITSEAAKMGIGAILSLVSLFSLSLALFNVFPIPVLDGGHLFFLIIEKLRGSPVSINIQERATQVGMVALLTFALFVCINDVSRFGLLDKVLEWVR